MKLHQQLKELCMMTHFYYSVGIVQCRIRGFPIAKYFPQENTKTPDITRETELAVVEGLVIGGRRMGDGEREEEGK